MSQEFEAAVREGVGDQVSLTALHILMPGEPRPWEFSTLPLPELGIVGFANDQYAAICASGEAINDLTLARFYGKMIGRALRQANLKAAGLGRLPAALLLPS